MKTGGNYEKAASREFKSERAACQQNFPVVNIYTIRVKDYDAAMAPERIGVEQSGRMCENREDGSRRFLRLPLILLKPCWNRGENHEENCNGQ